MSSFLDTTHSDKDKPLAVIGTPDVKPQRKMTADEIQAVNARIDAQAAELQAILDQQDTADQSTTPFASIPKDCGGVTEHHSWRVVTRVNAGGYEWSLVDSADDGARAGSVIPLDGGDSLDVVSEWVAYTPGTQVTGKLIITLAVSSTGTEITTAVISTATTPTADPYNTTAPVLVIPLFDIFPDGTISEYQCSDIDLQGMLFFDDSTPEDAGTAAHGDSFCVAAANHVHNAELPSTSGNAPFMVLQLNSRLVPIWDYVRAH